MYELVPDRPANGHRISPAMLNFMLDEYYEARGPGLEWYCEGRD
jgi:hypothetical protein